MFNLDYFLFPKDLGSKLKTTKNVRRKNQYRDEKKASFMKDADIQKFPINDGFNLSYRCWKATKSVRRVVVCIHGIGDYSGWFENIGPDLAADGNQVYALDLRGFGDSQEQGFPRGYVSNFERHLQDLTILSFI